MSAHPYGCPYVHSSINNYAKLPMNTKKDGYEVGNVVVIYSSITDSSTLLESILLICLQCFDMGCPQKKYSIKVKKKCTKK